MHLNKKKISEICTSALLAGGLATCIAPAVAVAATAAGTLIKNLATVTYQDINGNTYSAQSNEAVITVKQVFSAEMGSDTAKEAAPGQKVYIQHTLTNTGNGTDTFTLTVADDDSQETNGLTADSIKMYLDANGNGLADAGEQQVASGATITLAAGESAEIVLAVAVPNSASPGDDLGVKLTAVSANAGVVTDIGDDADTLPGTNQDLITVSNNAILTYTKSAVMDAVNGQITYTLTVSNTGNMPATMVTLKDGLPKGTTLLGAPTYAGLLTTNGDTLPAAGTLDEDADNIDYDNDGTIGGVVPGITAVDASIAPGQTISVTFIADYDPATFNNDSNPGSAGDVVKNTAHITADLDGNPATPPTTQSSNPTQTTMGQTYGVDASDTATADPDGDATTTNDGGDDDGTPDDTQSIDTAPSGSTVLYNVVLTNNGTGADTLELAINKGDFPAGTTFTYWNESGTAQLTNSNGEGGVDTGLLDAGESTTIMVKAVLPSSATSANSDPTNDGYTATLTATSANDPSPTPSSNAVEMTLGAISAPGVDISDNADGLMAGNQDEAVAPYDALNNATTDPGTRTTLDGTVGSLVKIPFYLDNESGSSDSYQFSAGSSYDGTTLGTLPAGWTVQYFKGDGAGNPTGSALTSSALLPAGATDVEYVAVIKIPADPAYAAADYAGTGAFDANGDGDMDQPIFIKVSSSNSGAADIMVDAIDVADLSQVSLTPPGSNQIQPGGSVDYIHTLENSGNTEETVELDTGNSNPEWNDTVTVMTNNGPKTLDQLDPATDVIIGKDAAGNPVNVTFTDTDNDGNPEVTLPPGVSIDLTPTVYAPSDAAPGSTNITTITATNTAGGPSTSLEDVSAVIMGQVRLDKTVAADLDCDGEPDVAGAFAANLTTEIAPTECAVWQIVAENQGDAKAMNVVITDGIPAFTTSLPNSLRYGLGAGATLTTLTDATGDDAGQVDAGVVSFYIGTVGTADPATGKGGELEPGEQATVRFSTRVD